MTKKSYTISMIIYVILFLMAAAGGALIFFLLGEGEIPIMVSFLPAYCAVLTATFHSLAYFKNYKFIYLTRTFLALGTSIWIALLLTFTFTGGYELIGCVVPFVITGVVLIVLAFSEKKEIVLSTDITPEEFECLSCACEQQKNKRKKFNLLSFTLFPVILFGLLLGICVASVIFVDEVDPYKNLHSNDDLFGNESVYDYIDEYNLPTTPATLEQNDAVGDIYENYTALEYNDMHFKNAEERISTMLSCSDEYGGYWLIDDNIDFIYYLEGSDGYYYSGVLVRNDYKLPDVKTAKVKSIFMGTNYKVDFTNEEIEDIRRVVIQNDYLEEEFTYFENKVHEKSLLCDIYWQFEGYDDLMYCDGLFVEFEDGTRGIKVDKYYYRAYILSKETGIKIKAFEKSEWR